MSFTEALDYKLVKNGVGKSFSSGMLCSLVSNISLAYNLVLISSIVFLRNVNNIQ